MSLSSDRGERKQVHLSQGTVCYRCITSDLPLGSHEIAMKADADLTIPGVARMVAEFVSALGLAHPTLVANDTGGAITQLVMTEHPDSVARVVLTSCDCFANFLPPLFRPLKVLRDISPEYTQRAVAR